MLFATSGGGFALVGLGSQIISDAAMQMAFFVFYCSTAAFSRHGFITSDAKQRVPQETQSGQVESIGTGSCRFFYFLCFFDEIRDSNFVRYKSGHIPLSIPFPFSTRWSWLVASPQTIHSSRPSAK
jgi:hypothetical protein